MQKFCVICTTNNNEIIMVSFSCTYLHVIVLGRNLYQRCRNSCIFRDVSCVSACEEWGLTISVHNDFNISLCLFLISRIFLVPNSYFHLSMDSEKICLCWIWKILIFSYLTDNVLWSIFFLPRATYFIFTRFCCVIHQWFSYVKITTAGINCEIHQSPDRVCWAITQQVIPQRILNQTQKKTMLSLVKYQFYIPEKNVENIIIYKGHQKIYGQYNFFF